MKRRYVMEFERPLAELESKLEELRGLDIAEASDELRMEIDAIATEVERLRATLYTSLSPWEKVQVSRHSDRPHTDDYLEALFTDVLELQGDKHFRDDKAMLAALATIGGRRVAVLGHRKGRGTKENIERNFGMPNPEGFRKAERVMRLADKFGLPIVTFVDTQGAYPGLEAEERGVSEAIAECLATLSGACVPVVVAVVGEGGSGGALAIGFGDHVVMLEHSYYSVITPEACAAILHDDSKKGCEVAGSLAMTAQDLEELGIVDQIVSEPLGGAHRDPVPVIESVGAAIECALDALAEKDGARIAEERYARLRRVGVFSEGARE